MNKRIKLKKLSGQGFRGILKRVWLDFEDQCKSLVLFGNNGDGKSSFTDVLEWFFTDKIEYLQREGCGREDYFNDFLPKAQDAVVEIFFSESNFDNEKILQRRGGHRHSNNTEDFKEYVQNSCKESFILRYHTMRAFVDKTKKDKLEEVEEIIGFEIVKETREALLRALNSLKSDTQLSQLRGQQNEREHDIAEILGTTPFNEADIIHFADELRKQVGHNKSISNVVTLKSVTEELDKKIKITEKGKQVAWLEQICENASKSKEILGLLKNLNQVVNSHNDLSTQREKVEASALEKLYKTGAEALKKGWAKAGECPLCKRPIDTDQLLESLKKELEDIQDLLEERNQNIQRVKSLKNKVQPLKNSLSALCEDKVKESLLASGHFEILERWSILFGQWEEIMNKMESSAESVSFGLPSIDSQNVLKTTLTQIEGAIESEKRRLVETEEEKKFYQNIQKLNSLRDGYLRLREIKGKIQMYEGQISSLNKIYQGFEEKEREGLSAVLEAISRDVNEYFKFLHPDEDFDQIELVPTEERGIEFRLKFYGKPISPPMKILSESHLNSLGICLFLAAAKHFNKINSFLILDDVVSSFDTNHRRPLARLLRDKFPDIQFLLFTHDDLWFELLKYDLPPNRWLFKELAKWSRENGVEVIESPMSLRERIQRCLDINDIDGAANKCRTFIEGILKEKCSNLGVRLESQWGVENDQREARELIDGLASYLKENQSLRQRENKLLFKDIRADQLLTNIGSHHRNLRTTSLARGDIEVILRDVKEFEDLFVCSNCKKQAQKSYSPRNSKLKQCKCGKLWI